MTGVKISTAQITIDAPQAHGEDRGGRTRVVPAHTMLLELHSPDVCIWDSECGDSGMDFYSFSQDRLHRHIRELPHIDEARKALAAAYAANRSNPLGAFIVPTINAIEDAIAVRDGSSVYFAGAGNRIKIGWSRKVGTRIAQLQTGNPEPVQLLATMPGGLSRERELHQRFAHARLVGEWFSADPQLLAFIDELNTNVIPFAREQHA